MGSCFGIGHPNIMRLFDAIDTQKQLYLVMECAKGKILTDILKEKSRMEEHIAAKILG